MSGPADGIEQSLLACMLVSPPHARQLAAVLTPEHFENTLNRTVFAAVRKLIETSTPIDGSLVGRQIKLLSGLDGTATAFVEQLRQSKPDLAVIEHHVEAILEDHAHRQMSALLAQAGEMAKDPAVTVAALAEFIEDRQNAILAGPDQLRPGQQGPQLFTDHEAWLDKRQANPGLCGYSSGYPSLDALFPGFEPSTHYVIGGSTGMGKSMIAGCLALNLLRQHINVLLFSLEMDRNSLMTRLKSRASGVPKDKMLRGACNSVEREAIKATEHLFGPALTIEDQPSMPMPTLEAKAMRWMNRVGTGVVFIDYLTKVSREGLDVQSTYDFASAVSHRAMMLSRKLQAPVVSLVQLNRGQRDREDKRPKLSDIRDSGKIEEDANYVFLLYRPYYYTKDEDDKRKAWLFLAKGREIREAQEIEMLFHGETADFRDKYGLDGEQGLMEVDL
ncbi:MAG: DnaB-like helicase C-terminal domain-containing protein [Bacteroidota bacterium]